MKNWYKEPLFHFLLLGAGIFVLYGWVAGVDKFRTDEIRITTDKQKNLALTFSRTWQRPPTRSELDGLIRDFIREEIAYREGLAMQLDADDVIIRRRLRQKFEIFARDITSRSPPTDERLQAYLDENSEYYRIRPLFTFQHILFRIDDDFERAEENALSLLQSLRSDHTTVNISAAGDRSLLPSAFLRVRAAEVDADFGTGFAEQIEALQPGAWHGPIRSGFGLHLVLIDERVDARMPSLDEVRNDVIRDLQTRNYNTALEQLYERLAENYTITIEPMSGDDASTAETAR